jgi:hypothetical protein
VAWPDVCAPSPASGSIAMGAPGWSEASASIDAHAPDVAVLPALTEGNSGLAWSGVAEPIMVNAGSALALHGMAEAGPSRSTCSGGTGCTEKIDICM